MGLTRRQILSSVPAVAAAVACPHVASAVAPSPGVRAIDAQLRNNLLLYKAPRAKAFWFESFRDGTITLSSEWGLPVRHIRQTLRCEQLFVVVARHLFPNVRHVRFLSRSMMTEHRPDFETRDLPFVDASRVTTAQWDDTISPEIIARGNALLSDIAPFVGDSSLSAMPAWLKFESYDEEILTLSSMNPFGVKRLYERGLTERIIDTQRHFSKVLDVRILSRHVYPFTELRAFEASRPALSPTALADALG